MNIGLGLLLLLAVPGVLALALSIVLLLYLRKRIRLVRNLKTGKLEFVDEQKMIKADKLLVLEAEQTTAAEKMMYMAGLIKSATFYFMKIQYSRMGAIAFIIAAMFAVGNWLAGCMFILGAGVSIGLGVFGMYVGTEINWRSTVATTLGTDAAFKVNYMGGAIGGYVSLGIAYLTVLLVTYFFGIQEGLLAALGLGASLNAIFARAGGGVFTKSADNGADIAGKSDIGLEEDDCRNAAVIADNGGDIINEMGASFADGHDTVWQAMIAILVLLYIGSITGLAVMPFAVMGIGIMACMIGALAIFVTKIREEGQEPSVSKFVRIFDKFRENPANLITLGNFTTYLFFMGGTAVLMLFGLPWQYYLSTVVCMIAAAIVGLGVDVYTSDSGKPTIRVAKLSSTNAALTIDAGVRNGFLSAALSCLVFGIAIWLAGWISSSLSSNIGIAFGALGMTALMANTFTIDGSGPISDNSKSLAEQAGLNESYQEISEKQDNLGNRFKANCKGQILGITAVASASMLITFREVALKVCTELGLVFNPSLSSFAFIAGLMMGAVGAYVFCGMSIDAVLSVTQQMVEFVKKDFGEITVGKKKEANYQECVGMATKAALRGLVKPTLTLVGLTIGMAVFGIDALAGFVAGTVVTCIPLGIWLSTSGGSWDNAKKIIEIGQFKELGLVKHSVAHINAIVGDMVGDIFKDIIGPLQNGIIAVVVLVAINFVVQVLPHVVRLIQAIF